jgi:hypothetical protein
MPNIDNQLTAGIPEGKRRGERELATASSSGGELGDGDDHDQEQDHE